MKCDDLETEQWLNYGGEPMPCYPAKDVDEAIAELKKEIERCQRYHDAEAVKWLAVTAKTETENRKLKRALWLARASALSRFDVDEYLRKYAHCNSRFWDNGYNSFNEACKQMQKAINIAEAKCRAKAEEYK